MCQSVYAGKDASTLPWKSLWTHHNFCLPFSEQTDKHWTDMKGIKNLQMSQNYSRQRCHHCTDFATRLKKQAMGWLFSEQTNRTLGCLLKRSGPIGGRTGRVSEAFLCLCWGTPEDKGNEIGQWKDCFDKLRLKLRCCYSWLFLGMKTESFRGRHTDTDMKAKKVE